MPSGARAGLTPARARAGLTPARARAGLTIVEVVLALGLLLLGMTSILGMLTFGAALARTAELRASASSAAEAVVADLEETLFPLERDPDTGALNVGEPRAVVDRPVPGHPGILYDATALGDPSELGLPGGPRRYRVDVEMHWRAGGRARTRTFTTLLLREVPFPTK
jgi:hypothetical protein